jgi:hypothetical protein
MLPTARSRAHEEHPPVGEASKGFGDAVGRTRTEPLFPESTLDLERGERVTPLGISLGDEAQAPFEAVLHNRSLTPGAMPFDICPQAIGRLDLCGGGSHSLEEARRYGADILAHGRRLRP